MQSSWPTPFEFMKGISLAIVSFVGLESISQAAEETQRPASIIPRTSTALILTILIFALSYANLALGMQTWHPIPLDAHGHPQMLWQWLGNNDNNGKAVALIARQVPYWGAIAAFYVPVLGAILLLISSNSGVFGSSRIAYAMASGGLLPSIFQRIHGRYRTPMISLLVFTGVALIEVIFAALPSLSPSMAELYTKYFHGEGGIGFLGDLYAFGAATSYSFVFVALVALRFTDPLSPRRFKIPINIPMRFRGERVEFPVVAVLGFIGITAILAFTLITHPIGRIAGPSWIAFGIILYFVYRKRKGWPLFRSRKRDWRGEQIEILRRAGELELMDEYVANVRASDERRGGSTR
jgi:APA family basic amino acid/polyamine antiporter